MIHWLVQSSAAHPDLARGVPPAGLLSAAEQERLAGFRVEKRRKEWLLGRWTAKHLLQAYCEETLGYRPPLEALIVGRVPGGGVPLAALDPHYISASLLTAARTAVIPLVGNRDRHDDDAMPAVAGVLLPLSLSISHSGEQAFCALSSHDAGKVFIGADIERITDLSERFIDSYFTPEEARLVRQAPAEQRDMLATATWSAKEAVLKALQVGLTVDTRRVTCLCQPADTVQDKWISADLRCDPKLLEEHRYADPSSSLNGWWRRFDGYVLTLAAIKTR